MNKFEQAINDGFEKSADFDLWSESARFQKLATEHRQRLRSQGYKTRTIRESIGGGIVITIMKKLENNY